MILICFGHRSMMATILGVQRYDESLPHGILTDSYLRPDQPYLLFGDDLGSTQTDIPATHAASFMAVWTHWRAHRLCLGDRVQGFEHVMMS